jgi:hypothetical protein
MNERIGKLRVVRVVVMAGALAVMAVGAVQAAIPGPNGVINACYDKQSGQVRIVDPTSNLPKPCGPKELPLAWNAQGAAGHDGADGTDGTDGVSGYERVMERSDLDSTYDKTTWALCPEGKKVIGGGAGVYGTATGEGQEVIHGVALIQDHPFNDDGWSGRAEEIIPTDSNWVLQVWAICATVN